MKEEIIRLQTQLVILKATQSELRVRIDELQKQIDSIVKEEKQKSGGSLFNRSVRDIGLSVRTANALLRGNYLVVGDLMNASYSMLKNKISGYGVIADREIRQKLRELSLWIPE